MSERAVQLLIIGSGAAGLTAAIYAARAGRNPVVLNGPQPGGQLTISAEVENYPGYTDPIDGPFLMEQMMGQAKRVGTEIIDEWVTGVDLSDGKTPHKIMCDSGNTYLCDALIVASGAQAQWLGLPSEEKYNGRGVSACATCDGFFFRNQNIIVVGGGNTAVEEALYLANIVKSVTVIHRRTEFRAEQIMQDRLFAKDNISVKWNRYVDEVLGDDMGMNAVRLKAFEGDEEETLEVTGMFVAIGHKPATEPFKGALEMDKAGYLICPPGTVNTAVPGVFAAGDCVDKVYRQAVTAAGMGCMAALDAERYLDTKEANA